MSIRRSVVASTRRVPALTLAAGAVMSLAFAAESASAQFTWIGPAGGTGTMSVPANWGGGVAPLAGDITTTLTFVGNGAPPPSAAGVGQATNDIANPLDVDSLFFNLAYSGGFTVNGSTATHAFRLNGTGVIQQNGLGNVTLSSSGGLLNLATNASISGSGLGNLTFAGVISESGGPRSITVSGAGATHNSRVVVLNAANTFSGGVTINNGAHLQLGNSAALGSGLSALTVGAGGGILSTNASITPTAVAGTTIALNGQLRFIGASTLTLGSNLALAGAGNLLINNTSGSALTVQSNSSGYSGSVTIDVGALPNISTNLGTITLNGNNGAMVNVPTWNIRAGGGLALSSNVTGSIANLNRIGDTAAVNLRNGVLTLTGAVAGVVPVTETMGALSGAGYSTVAATPGTTAGATTLAASSLSRADRGTFLFRGTSLGGTGNVGFITFASAPTADLVGGGGGAGTTNISILPYAIGDTSGSGTGNAFVTYGATGVRPLAATEYVANLISAADSNVNLAAATANAGSVTLNALRLSSSGSVSGAGTLNVTSGAVLSNNGSSIIANSVNFGAVEGRIFTPAGLTISGPLTGTGGLTKSGTSNLILSGDNSGLAGQLTVNNGFVVFAAGNNLPGTGTIVANGTSGGTSSVAGLQYTGATPLSVARDLTIGSGWFNLRSTSLAGPITYGGVISGAGGIYVDTVGDVILSGNNTYSGPTRVNNGNIRISSDANLGSGAFDFGNGSSMGIVLDGDWTTSRHINASLTSGTLTFNTQGFNATLNGRLTNFGSGGLGGSTDSIRKAGTGTLRINAPGTMSTYGIVVNSGGGEIRLANDGALLSTSYTVNSSGRLVLDNATVPTGTGSGAQVVSRLVDNSTVTLASGGTLNLIGNGSQSLTEVIGTLTATGSGNILQVNSSGSQVTTLRIGNLSAGSGSLLVRGDNLGATMGSIGRILLNQFNGVAVSVGQILSNITGEDLSAPGVIEQAVYDGPAIGIRLLNPVLDFSNGVAIQNAAPTSLPTTANFRVNPSFANPVPVLDAANTINALRFAPLGIVDYNAGVNSVLTITSGSLLTEAGGAASIAQSGVGILTLTSGAANLAVTTNSNLTSAAALGGSGGLTKTGGAILALNGGGSNTGALSINSGTVSIGAPVTFGNLSSLAATSLVLNAPLTLTPAAPSTANGTISGASPINLSPTAPALLTLGGNNAGFSGGIVGSAAARLGIANPAALGTGTVDLSAQTASSSFSIPTLGFNFGPNASVTVANNFVFSTTPAINVFLSPQNSLANVSGTVELSGVLSGGSAAGTTTLWWEENNITRAYVLRPTNSANTFRGLWRTEYGTLAVVSDAALGDTANGITLANSSAAVNGDLRFDADNIALASTRTITAAAAGAAINTNGFTATISGVLAGTAVLNKIGTGTLILTNSANTISSNVTVSAGTLLVNGNLPGATTPNTLTVAAAATLGGSGTIGTSSSALRNIAVNGTLSPGNSPGVLTSFGNLSMNAGSTLLAELAGPAVGTGYDQMVVNGTVTLASTGAGVTLSAGLSYLPAPTLSDVYWILLNDGTDAIIGTFAGALEGAIVSLGSFNSVAYTAQISYVGNYDSLNPTVLGIGTGNDVVLYNIVPAPGAAGLLGIAGLLAARRRRR